MHGRDRSMKLGSQNKRRTCGTSGRHTPRHPSRGINSLSTPGGDAADEEVGGGEGRRTNPGVLFGFSFKSFPTVQIALRLAAERLPLQRITTDTQLQTQQG